jgi:hypothetical protein
LQWLARLDVAGIEPLGLALGFGRRARYSHLARLTDAGLVVRAFDPGGSVVAITAAGRRALGQPGAQVRVSATHGLALQRARAVSWAAALLTIRGREWLSARELRRDPSWRLVVGPSIDRAHRPNLGVMVRHSRVAIEVELWRRPPRKVRLMMSSYSESIASGQIDGLITVSDGTDVLEALSHAAGQVGLSDRRFAMRRLADVQATSHLLRQQVSGEIARGHELALHSDGSGSEE